MAALGVALDSVQAATPGADEELLRAHWHFKLVFMHLVSLLHAVALSTLRADFKLCNLEVCAFLSPGY